MYKSFLTIFILSFLGMQSQAQTLTLKDFKLCLDDIGCSDSTLRISKKKMLEAKLITANFAWLNIKSLTIYIGEGNYTSEITAIHCKGNLINKEAKEIFKRLQVGSLITILVEGYNKKGQSVDWGSLTIVIKEE